MQQPCRVPCRVVPRSPGLAFAFPFIAQQLPDISAGGSNSAPELLPPGTRRSTHTRPKATEYACPLLSERGTGRDPATLVTPERLTRATVLPTRGVGV
jgi:hypothetical protein